MKKFNYLKSYETLNLAKPSKKSVLSPQATTWIDYNEVLDTLIKDSELADEDLGLDVCEQLSANREAAIEILKECTDAELAYNYLNCSIGRGILIGIMLTILGNLATQAEIKALEAAETDAEDDEYGP